MTESPSPRCNLRPGQKVVCVDDSPNQAWPELGRAGLLTGQVYTIRVVNLSWNGDPQILLEELHKRAGLFPDRQERGYHPRRFERVYDLTIFHEICAQATKPALCREPVDSLI